MAQLTDMLLHFPPPTPGEEVSLSLAREAVESELREVVAEASSNPNHVAAEPASLSHISLSSSPASLVDPGRSPTGSLFDSTTSEEVRTAVGPGVLEQLKELQGWARYGGREALEGLQSPPYSGVSRVSGLEHGSDNKAHATSDLPDASD